MCILFIPVRKWQSYQFLYKEKFWQCNDKASNSLRDENTSRNISDEKQNFLKSIQFTQTIKIKREKMRFLYQANIVQKEHHGSQHCMMYGQNY
jgi:hypothetical protein